jgi:hypothetical protein
MKQLFLLVIGLCMAFNCSHSNPISGAADDVNSGSLFGQLMTDGKKIGDTVTVALFDGDTSANLAKQKAVKKDPVRAMKSFNGSYEFDSLPAGSYRVEVTKDSIVIGGERKIKLGTNERKEINITVVIIINQTFNIWTDNSKNVTINNFYLDNGKVAKSDSGYVISFAKSDTVLVKVDVSKDGSSRTFTMRVIRKADGTTVIETVDAPADIKVTPGTKPATADIGVLQIDLMKPGTTDIKVTFDTSAVPKKSD